MEEVEDFNQILKSNLTEKTGKKDLSNVLETCKNVLKSEINKSKNFENLFQMETWNIFSSSIEGFNISNIKSVTLQLLQLYTIIAPKGKREHILRSCFVFIYLFI